MDSINDLMNSLTYKLIFNNDLLPHRNQFDQYMAYGPYRVLEKAYINNILIVKIINGDVIGPENIRTEISKSIELIRQRRLNRLKPVTLHFVICTVNDYMTYKQIADEFSAVLQMEHIPVCITLAHAIINNVYAVNLDGYLNNNINNMVYQSFGGRIIYDYDIENLLAGKRRHDEQFKFKWNISVTKIIIGINALFLILGLISDRILGYDILKIYGVQRSIEIMYGKQYWRFITPIFLHGDIIHLMSNSYFLFICGELVEKYIGKVKFIILYLLTGIIGNIVSFFTIEPWVASLGASGACLGIGGILVYMWINKEKNFLKYYSGITSLVIMIVINIFYGFTTTGVDNGAHVGGFVSGFVLAFIVDKTIGLSKEKKRKINFS